MKRKKKKIVKSQMLSLKGKIEKYLTKEDYYDLFNKAKASLNISKMDYKGTYIFARLIGKNFITATELDFSSSYEYGKELSRNNLKGLWVRLYRIIPLWMKSISY